MRRRELLWIAGVGTSLFGSNALYIAFVVWIQQLTGSATLAGFAIVAYMAPAVLSPFLGLIVDRVRRSRLLIINDIVQAFWVCLAFSVHDAGQVWLLYLVLVGMRLGSGLESPAAGALLATLVPPERRSRANAIFRTCKDLSRTLAPTFGVLVSQTVGVRWLIAIDVATFAVSVLCLAYLRAADPKPEAPTGAPWHEVAAGIRHIVDTAVLRRIVGVLIVALLGLGMIDPLLIYALQHGLHVSAGYFGVAETVTNVGSILAGLLCVRWSDRVPPQRLVRLGLALFAIGLLPLLVPYLPAYLAGCFVMGMGAPIALIGFMTVVMNHTPNQLQGRVMAATDSAMTLPQAISAAAAAGLLALLPYQALLGAMAMIVSLCALALTDARPRARAGGDAPIPGLRRREEAVVERLGRNRDGPAYEQTNERQAGQDGG
jgi:MFS family permease